ncbi:FAD synthase [Methanosarcinales archaeon]|nr:MAG: FAD synthase [Methanosarcinales archaeon]
MRLGKKVLATGTFEFLHPGHLHYLREAKKLGDELIVLVARDSMIKHKPKPIIPEKQRLEVVSALKLVDKAVLGSNEDMYKPLYELKPDIVALGYDQLFDEDELKRELKKRNLNIEVVRIKSKRDGELCSSKKIIDRILSRAYEN